jgi:hypothetical protein
MNVIARVLRAIAALFVDDGRLALHVLALLVVTASIVIVAAPPSWLSIVLLVSGTLALLVRSVVRAARKPTH